MLNTLSPIIFVVLWSTGFIGAKYALPYAEPFTLLCLRFSIVVVVMLLLRHWVKQQALSKPQMLHAALVGLLIHGCYLGGVFFAISKGFSASYSALIVGLQPILTTLLSIIFTNDKVNRQHLFGMALGLLGVVFIISGSLADQHFHWLGFGACLLALVAISAGTVYQKRTGQNSDLFNAVIVQYAAAGIFLLVLSLLLESRQIQWSWTFILAMGWLVIALSLGAVLLLMRLLKQGQASRVSSLFYLVPPFTSLEAWLLFSEQLSMGGIIGMILCCTGVALVMRQANNA